MKKLAIIDIGSNSIKLLISDTYAEKYSNTVYEEKINLRLSDFLSYSNNLTDYGISKLEDSINHFKYICDKFSVDNIIAVATETFRKLENSQQLIKHIKLNCDVEIRILQGKEEAYFGYLATLNTIDISDYLQIDIGGASMEICLVKNKKLLNSISIPLGAIPICNRFNLKGSICEEDEKEFKIFIENEFNKIEWLKEAKKLPVVGVGGSVRCIAKIHRENNQNNIKYLHNYEIEYKDVKHIYDYISKMSLEKKLKVKGLSKNRADIFLGCLITVKSIMSYINSDTMVVSKFGIRQGLVFGQLSKVDEDIVDNHISSLLLENNLDLEKYDNIYKQVIKLTKNLEPELLQLKKIVLVASKMIDIGKNFETGNTYKSTFYYLLNNKINGISNKEQIMSAYVIKFLGKNNFKLDSSHKELITDCELNYILKICYILKIIIDLEFIKEDFVEINTYNDYMNIICTSNTSKIYVEYIESYSELFLKTFSKKINVIRK